MKHEDRDSVIETVRALWIGGEVSESTAIALRSRLQRAAQRHEVLSVEAWCQSLAVSTNPGGSK